MPFTDPPERPALRVRRAEQADVQAMHALIQALAEYEREPDAVEASEQDLHRALFADRPLAHAHVAEVAPADRPETRQPGITQACTWEVVGIALWFVSYSTWRGRHGIWLEDLFVLPAHRGLGLGRALLAALAAETVERGYARLEWNVLDWNSPALDFYASLGAQPLDAWTVHRLDGDALSALAAAATDASRAAGRAPWATGGTPA